MMERPFYRPVLAHNGGWKDYTNTTPTMNVKQLSEMIKGLYEKRPVSFTVICENKEAFMGSRTCRERLLILNAYATIKENPTLGSLGLKPGLYTGPGGDRIYYHITTPPAGELKP